MFLVCFLFIASLYAQEGPLVTAEQVTLVYSEQGQVKFQLLAAKAMNDAEGNITYPEGAVITFYEAGKQVAVTARAKKVFYDAEKKYYSLQGNVVVHRNADGRQLKTEVLHWHAEKGTLSTDRRVTIVMGEDVLMGDGLTAQQDLSSWHILKPQGVLYVSNEKG